MSVVTYLYLLAAGISFAIELMPVVHTGLTAKFVLGAVMIESLHRAYESMHLTA